MFFAAIAVVPKINSQQALGQTTKGPASKSVDKNDPQYLLPVTEHQADQKIPTSEQVLRYRWGDDISSHRQIEIYLQALAKAAPDRTKLVQYGGSYEDRSLNYLVISSPENIARLDQIRQNNLKLADPRQIDTAIAKDLIEKSPAVIWLAYCVHGNEISPSDAAILTAYHLLSDKRPETRKMLEQLVVVIDPLQNPDGRDRFVNVYRETRGSFHQTDPLANEHTERWPNGRSNHYWFDMNRDWFRHSQREVKAKVAAYLDWQPQIYVDAHEMGRNSTFYFPPPTDPKNPYLLPAQHDWFGRLGKHQAGWFDKYGFGYMTREVFDAFYPGYGSEWPTLQGGLGVLWEQASARGQVIERDDDTELTYHDGVRNHYISGLATLEFAARNRQQLLQNFYDAKASAIKLGSEGDVKHYFIRANQRPQRVRRFVNMLQRNGIEVRVVEKPLNVECIDCKNNDEHRHAIAAGSFHIPAAQPAARLLRALLDRKVEMDEKFLRRQLERNQLRLPDEIYDVTAWSMPLAFDVECLASGESINVDSKLWDGNTLRKQVALTPAQIAYLVPGTDGAMQAVSHLIQNGVRVHCCDEPFRIGGRQYERGTLIVKVAGNSEKLHAQMEQACAKFGIEAVPTDTAFVEEGAHMGGPQVHWIRPPKILLVVNRPTNYSSGHTWHLFDQVMKYPTTRVKGTDFGRVNLSKFNTIVLPDGNYSKATGFDEARAKALQEWVSTGGTLITLRGATSWATGKDIGLIKNKVVKRKVAPPEKSSAKGDGGKKDDDEKSEPEEVTPDNVPGAFFRANVFQKHWVTFGAGKDLDVFYTGRLVLSPTKETEGRSLVTFAKRDDLLTSGFCWPTSLELIAETPYVVYRRVGQGHIISFTDDPNFRAMYPSLQRFFINAAMLGAAH
jgi:hypothetical protein